MKYENKFSRKFIKDVINKIKLFWFSFRKKVEVYPVSYDEVKELLTKKFKNCFIEVEDLKYYTCDYETAKLIASIIPTRLRTWKKESYDCDNFSKTFWAIVGELFPRLPVGRCNVKRKEGLHSLNFILYKTSRGRLSFSYIEPQNGKLSYFNYRPYLMIL